MTDYFALAKKERATRQQVATNKQAQDVQKVDYSEDISRLEKQVVFKQAQQYDPSVTSERFEDVWLNAQATIDENKRKSFVERTIKETGYAPSENIISQTLERNTKSLDYYDALLSSADELGIDYNKKGINYEKNHYG